jgi:hypothetical protein
MGGAKSGLAVLGLLAVAAASAQPGQSYFLGLRVQEFTAALVNNQPREIYRMFVPGFQQEVSYARFESVYVSWQNGRRLSKARSQLVDVRGPGGHSSTYAVFAGESDYSYIYGAWLRTDGTWHLAWLSNILDPGFQYGSTDSASSLAVAVAALDFALSDSAPAQLRRTLLMPETLAFIDRAPHPALREVAGRPVVWIATQDIIAGTAPRVPFFCELQVVRVFGDMAQATVDFLPGLPGVPGRLNRTRGVEVYLRRDGGGWRFDSVGKLF